MWRVESSQLQIKSRIWMRTYRPSKCPLHSKKQEPQCSSLVFCPLASLYIFTSFFPPTHIPSMTVSCGTAILTACSIFESLVIPIFPISSQSGNKISKRQLEEIWFPRSLTLRLTMIDGNDVYMHTNVS